MRPAWRSRSVTAIALFLEGCTLYLVFSTVSSLIRLEHLQPPFWLVLVSLAWGYALSLWVLGLQITPVLRGVMGMAVGVPCLLVLVAWNAGLPFLPFGLLMPLSADGLGLFVGSTIFLLITWWRGVQVSREEATLDSVRSAFQVGMITLLATALIDAATPGRIVSGFFVVGFFSVGLLGMALARFSADGGEEREMPRQWLWPIVACVAGVLLLGLLISGLGLGGLDDVSRAVTGLIGAVGLRILEPVLMLVGLIAGGLVNLGNWISGLTGGGDFEGLLEAQRRINEFHEDLRGVESDQQGNLLFSILQWVAAVLGALAAVGMVYWLFRSRRRHAGSGQVVEVRESLFSLSRAGDEMNEALGSIFSGRWGGSRRRSRIFTTPRDYYHALLEMARSAGRPKDSSATPREHQRDLAGILPADPVSRIVDDFQDAHYGAVPADDEQMQRLERDRLALEEFLDQSKRDC